MLANPIFEAGVVNTAFIDENPSLLKIEGAKWNFASPVQSDQKNVFRVEQLTRYMANLAVNGHPKSLGANPDTLDMAKPAQPITMPPPSAAADHPAWKSEGWRSTLLKDGPAAG